MDYLLFSSTLKACYMTGTGFDFKTSVLIETKCYQLIEQKDPFVRSFKNG